MTTRLPIHIPVRPWFRDHHIDGRTILPAVESMLLLTKFARDLHPEIQPTTLLNGVFSKMFIIPESSTELAALVEVETEQSKHGEQLCLTLLSKIQLTKMSRIQEHVRICFPLKPRPLPVPAQGAQKHNSVTIDARRIYQDLVPFGPCYQSLIGTLHLNGNYAWGTVLAPSPGKQPMEELLGSPFPLDGAMHAACVLGQCIAGFVPFPVGFKRRQVLTPTRAGDRYHCLVCSKSLTPEELLVDLVISDGKGRIYEIVTNLRMRDVTQGRVRPAADLPRLAFSEP